MKRIKSIFSMLIMVVALASFSSCANTARGVERDAEQNAEEVGDAAEDAGDEVEDATDDVQRRTNRNTR
jgi:predicted small secreted protein